MGIIDSIWHRLQATLHGALGRVWFRLRRPLRARRHFERVLLLRGEDFATYVYLGRIAFACGDYAGWRRELRHAHHTNPERFARLDFGAMSLGSHGLRPRLAGTGIDARLLPFDIDDTAGRATWAAQLAPVDLGGPDAEVGGQLGRKSRRGEEAGGFTDAELDALLPESMFPDGPLPEGADGMLPDSLLSDFEAACDRAREAGSAPHGDDFASADERRRFAELGPIRATDVARCNVDDLLRKLTG